MPTVNRFTPSTTDKGKNVITDRLQTTQATYLHGPSFMQMGEQDQGSGGTYNTNINNLLGAIGGRTAIAGAGTTNGTYAESLQTTTVANDTYQVIGTLTASGTWAITEAGLFTAAASGTGDMFAYADFNVVNLNANDSIQFTWKVQFT